MKKIGLQYLKEAYLNSDYDRENFYIWYAESNGNIIASIMLEIDGKIGKLQGVCCRQDYRGKDISKQLLNHVISFCKQNNVNKIRLGTYQHLERAIGFYKKNGFKELEHLRDDIEKSRFYELEF